jgi:uncharacterized delta-60 repeat protein
MTQILKKFGICIFALVLCSAPFDSTLAQSPGSLDTSFDPGKGIYNFSDPYHQIYTIAVQQDGKILIGGNFTAYNDVPRRGIVRLNSDGTIDETFNPGTGFSTPGTPRPLGDQAFVYDIAIQSDGKIIVAGNFTQFNGTNINRIARLNPDGGLDTTFNPGAGPNLYILDLAIQPDGKIIIVGRFTQYDGTLNNRIARLNEDGALDATFQTGTGATYDGFDIHVSSGLLQPDGKILVGGNFIQYNGIERNRIARINPDGSIDNSFTPPSTIVSADQGNGEDNLEVGNITTMSLQEDGKIIIGGSFLTYGGVNRKNIARIHTNGTLDTSFRTGNAGANGSVLSSAIQPDGKVVIGGVFTSYRGQTQSRIARIHPDGTVDADFLVGTGVNGMSNWSFRGVQDMVTQADGRILIAGKFEGFNDTLRNSIARIHLNVITPPVDVVTPPDDDITPPVDVITPPVDVVTPPSDVITSNTEIATERRFLVYPNPTAGVVRFSETVNVYLTNPMGQVLVIQTDVNSLDISAQSRGIYFLTFTNKRGQVVQRSKIVKE